MVFGGANLSFPTMTHNNTKTTELMTGINFGSTFLEGNLEKSFPLQGTIINMTQVASFKICNPSVNEITTLIKREGMVLKRTIQS